MPKYDTTEAQELLTQFADRLYPDHRGRTQAVAELFESLLSLHDHGGFSWMRQGPDGILVTAPGGIAKAKVVHAGGKVLIYTMGGTNQTVPLEYDPVTKTFLSRADDPRPRAATERPVRRSAVAEIVAAVVRALDQGMNTE